MKASIDHLVAPTAYQAARVHIFPSVTSLRWFMRKHRKALIERHALLLLAGRLLINTAAFDEEVLAAGHSAMETTE